jgi:hypothetical protein
MKKLCVKIIAIFAFLLTIIGIVGFFGDILLSCGLYRVIPDSFEMPLGDLRGIAVDSEGNIYCGAQFYSRIQIYDIEGSFLYGKCLDSHSGAFKIKININDQLEVAKYRGDQRYIFAKDGTLLSKRSNVSNFLVGFEKINDYYCYDENRDITYQIKPILLPWPKFMPFFGSYVIKKDTSGKETVIIKTPFYKWLFMGPFPGFLFIFIGLLIYKLILGKKFRLFCWTINRDKNRDIKSINDLRVDRF